MKRIKYETWGQVYDALVLGVLTPKNAQIRSSQKTLSVETRKKYGKAFNLYQLHKIEMKINTAIASMRGEQ